MAQKTPYIGSKISLLSKLDIRYEGVLYTVNSTEKTISLSKVRSFGTEDRPSEQPVPSNDDVFEFVVFKAADIKELMVCETPKITSALRGGLPNDPAIVSFSATPAFSPPSGVSTPYSGNQRRSRLPNSGFRLPHSISHLFRGPFCQNHGYHGGTEMNQSFSRAADGLTDMEKDEFGRSSPNRLKFESDYDFEAANVKFQGLSLQEEGDDIKAGGEVEPKPAAETGEENSKANEGLDVSAFYDKKVSFFDRISSQSEEKEKNENYRADWKKLRKTDEQTFGHSAVRLLACRRAAGRNGGVHFYGQSFGRTAGGQFPSHRFAGGGRFIPHPAYSFPHHYISRVPLDLNVMGSRLRGY
uniref:FFD box profile domain-containing protein n=1 Tax=Ditylenchus dipsaci TaxID=166011 RepID=A0A915D2K7_9BILA